MTTTTALPALGELKLTMTAPGVLLVELDRPDRLHALSETLGESLIQLSGLLQQRTPSVASARCVVLSGTPCAKLSGNRSFSTGRDLKLSAEHNNDSDRSYYMQCALESVLAWRNVPIPTVASVEGPCFGWGAEVSREGSESGRALTDRFSPTSQLALACDLRVVAGNPMNLRPRQNQHQPFSPHRLDTARAAQMGAACLPPPSHSSPSPLHTHLVMAAARERYCLFP